MLKQVVNTEMTHKQQSSIHKSFFSLRNIADRPQESIKIYQTYGVTTSSCVYNMIWLSERTVFTEKNIDQEYKVTYLQSPHRTKGWLFGWLVDFV